jgi:hypothetical protein
LLLRVRGTTAIFILELIILHSWDKTFEYSPNVAGGNMHYFCTGVNCKSFSLSSFWIVPQLLGVSPTDVHWSLLKIQVGLLAELWSFISV